MKRHRFKKAILACGTESKGVFSLAKGHNFFMSRNFGNLLEYKNFLDYKRAMKRDLRRMAITPDIIAHDLHPQYNSSILAKEIKKDDTLLMGIQHHHAHIASCMFDNGLDEKVIGVALDGTGYGLDGKIWGGEFLISSPADFERVAHLRYIPMPGGEAAIKQPWKMAAAYLRHSYGEGFLDDGAPFTKMIRKKDWQIVNKMVSKGINSPLTSSAGRLFDAVASMVMGIFEVSHEAEAAVKLEQLAWEAADIKSLYRIDISKEDGKFIIDPAVTIKSLLKDMKSGVDSPTVAARFHNTIAKMICDMCKRIKKKSGIKKVALSGGVFQNRLLTEKAHAMLREDGFEVFTHRRFPVTDAGIAAGQAFIADAME